MFRLLKCVESRRYAWVENALVIFPSKEEVEGPGVPAVSIINPPLELIAATPAVPLAVEKAPPVYGDECGNGNGRPNNGSPRFNGSRTDNERWNGHTMSRSLWSLTSLSKSSFYFLRTSYRLIGHHCRQAPKEQTGHR
jgi:hypothetical protein